ncbi:hypothetical protein D5086_027097 [Populus alba]|uniref:Uncharacterized protein n=1 Tax=Populus alba TaxID=43335 RepID=A0ACC4B3M9_POPAL
MLYLLEEILRKHCMHSLKSKRQSTHSTCLRYDRFKKYSCKIHICSQFQEKGKFPYQPHQNPKRQYNANASSSGSQHMDQVKLVITLRSGKVIEKPTLEPCENDDESISEGEEGVESEHCKEKTDSPPALPFPHAMTKQRKVNHNSKIFETFKQVRINILLLDAIKQVPSYARFLKDLCTAKRKLNVKKKAFLVEQVSVILQNNNALKYKDHGCPTISCFIGEHKIERAVLDLGASVNLLTYSFFQSLNLGRPFLTTSNALINCRNGLMKLSFRNMTLKMNIFNICKQPGDDNDLQEVDFIEELVHDQLESTLSKTENDESEDLQMIYSREEITGEKCIENVDVDLLSRVTTNSTSDITPINDYFPKKILSFS